MDELEKIRNEINSVDERILEALANRRSLERQIVRAKDQSKSPIRDSLREEQLLDSLIAKGRRCGLDAHLVTRVFHEIIDDSIRSQEFSLLDDGKRELKRVAFQGVEGSYGELAGSKYFSPYMDHTLFVGMATFEQVIHVLEAGVKTVTPSRDGTGGVPAGDAPPSRGGSGWGEVDNAVEKGRRW